MQTAPTQNQLFLRVTLIVLMMGILIGIVLTLAGLNLSNYLASQRGTPLLAKPLADELSNGIYPIHFLIFGALILLYGKLRAVRKQVQIVGQRVERRQAAMEPAYFVIGVYCLLFGGIGLLVQIFALALPVFLGLLLFPGGVLCPLVVIVYLQRRSARQATW